MNNMPIIALIGIAILVTSTVGFGATLATTPDINRIGGSENNPVNAARANITALVWTEEVGFAGAVEIDQIIFAVGNEDIVNTHEFQICAVIEAINGTFMPNAGQAPACTTTGVFAASGNSTGNTIDFPGGMNVTQIKEISFSIEELQ